MGLSEKEYWRCTPLNFYRMGIAHERNYKRFHVWFREMYALHANINREKDTPIREGKELFPYYDEQPPEAVSRPVFTKADRTRIEQQYNK